MAKYRFDEIAINSIAKKKPVEKDKHCYIGLEHLDGGNLKVTRYGSDVAPIGEKLIMKKGDVLFGKRRAYQKKVAIAPFDGIFSAHGMVLRPKEDVITKEFFPLFISSDYFLDRAINISVGSLSPTINWSALKGLEFNLPSIDEQGKIAELLWAMNDTREAYKKLLALTDEMVRARFIEMFGETAIIKNEWQKIAISEILDKPISGEWGTDAINGVGVPVLRTTNFSDSGEIVFSDMAIRNINSEKVNKKAIHEGDILIEKSGGSGTKPVGRVIYCCKSCEGYLFNNFTAMLRIKDHVKYNSIYVFYFLFHNYWSGGTKLYENQTTGIHNLRLSDYLESTFIPMASIEQQNNFADIIRQSNKSKLELKRTLDELESVYKSLLHEIFG